MNHCHQDIMQNKSQARVNIRQSIYITPPNRPNKAMVIQVRRGLFFFLFPEAHCLLNYQSREHDSFISMSQLGPLKWLTWWSESPRTLLLNFWFSLWDFFTNLEWGQGICIYVQPMGCPGKRPRDIPTSFSFHVPLVSAIGWTQSEGRGKEPGEVTYPGQLLGSE